jgi:hypothetical protein
MSSPQMIRMFGLEATWALAGLIEVAVLNAEAAIKVVPPRRMLRRFNDPQHPSFFDASSGKLACFLKSLLMTILPLVMLSLPHRGPSS